MTNTKNNEYKKCREKLEDILNSAINESSFSIKDDVLKTNLDIILENSEKKKGVLAVVVTSLIKKIMDPKQDIRKHQDKMNDGYSGRSLDFHVVTPFLKENQFPAMAESGWLTRSLEQSQPYTLDYLGAVTPKKLKTSFLNIFDIIENKKVNANASLIYLFQGLVSIRNSNSELKLANPVNLSIGVIISHLNEHFTSNYQSSGASRLPVLAIYSSYKQMIGEIGRYKKCKLKPLEAHTSADRRSGAIGDIEIVDEDQNVFEAVEIKHNIKITSNMVNEANIKFRSAPVKRYYLLSTDETIKNDNTITDEIIKISQTHGCQVIVNGVMDTLKYYLRLLNNPDDFIRHYVDLLEKEDAIKFEHKQKWNDIILGKR